MNKNESGSKIWTAFTPLGLKAGSSARQSAPNQRGALKRKDLCIIYSLIILKTYSNESRRLFYEVSQGIYGGLTVVSNTKGLQRYNTDNHLSDEVCPLLLPC